MDKGVTVSLQPLHDESFAAKEANAQPPLERDADAHTFGRRQKRIFLRYQLAAYIGKVNGQNLARIWSAEGQLLARACLIDKDGHEQRLTRQQTLTCTH